MSSVAGAALVDVPHDSESSTGGSGSGTSLPEDAVLNPVKPSLPGERAFISTPQSIPMVQ